MISFAVENYAGFAEKSLLTLGDAAIVNRYRNPPKNNTWQDHVESVAGIFGANASGKSTFLSAIVCLTRAISTPNYFRDAVEVLYRPFKTRYHSSDNYPSSFELDGVFADQRWEYRVAVDSQGVVSEYLTTWEGSYKRKIIERTRQEIWINWGREKNISRKNIAEVIPHKSLAVTMASLFEHPDAEKFCTAIKEDFAFISPEEADKQARHAWLTEALLKRPEWAQVVNLVLQVADLGISGFRVNEEVVPNKYVRIAKRINEVINSELGEEGQTQEVELEDEEAQQMATALVLQHRLNGKEIDFNLEEESRGTIAWLNVAIPAIYMLVNGKTLVCDELDDSLHPSLVALLVSLYSNPRVNTKGAQLVFNTHDVSLLERYPEAILKREEIWFSEKDANGNCALYSLPEGVRKENNIAKLYFQGALGGMPYPQSLALEKLVSEFNG